MSILKKVRTFVSRYGAPAKFVAKTIVGVAVPGSGPVLELIDKLIDCAHESAKDNLESLASAEDLQRIEKMFDVMLGDLQDVAEHLRHLEQVPDIAQKTWYATLRTEEHCFSAAKALQAQAKQLSAVSNELAKLSTGQEELRELHLRSYDTMLDYIAEQRQHNVPPSQLNERLKHIEEALRADRRGDHGRAVAIFAEESAAQPDSAALAVAEAAVQATGHNFVRAARTLARAARLRPNDIKLGEMSRIATNYSRGATPVGPRPGDPRCPQAGDILDGWRLEQLLGFGGWGQVFLAHKGECLRALKIMHAELSQNAEFVKRFKCEMSLLVALEAHPHLVCIDTEHLYGWASDWNCWYYVMDYIEGITLQRRLESRGALNLRQVRTLFTGIAEGLAKAHERGIVHRDIKPANILIRKAPLPGQGQGVLVDFGLAGFVDPHSRGTNFTASFAAPEQLRDGVSNCRSDVYSLAATIYHCLLHGDADKRGRYKAKLLPEAIPASVRDFLERCLDNDPDERPKDGRAFVEEWCKIGKEDRNTKIINVSRKNFGRVVVEKAAGVEKKKIVYFIERSTPVPAVYREWFDTQFDNQDAIEINVMEAEGLDPPLDPIGPACVEIKRLCLPLPPNTPKGCRLLVTYTLGEDGRLLVKMIEPRSGQAIDESVDTFNAIMEQELDSYTVVCQSLGVIALSKDQSCYINDIIIKKGQPMPNRWYRRYLLRTHQGGGNEFEVYPTQGESENPSDCYFLGRYCFTDVTHIPNGDAIVKVAYDHDENGIVKVSATDEATGKTLPMRVESIPEDMSWLHRAPEPLS